MSKTKKRNGSSIQQLKSFLFYNFDVGQIQTTASYIVVCLAYRLDDRGVGVRVLVVSRMSTTPYRPGRLKGPASLLPNGYKGAFTLGGKAAGSWSWPFTSNYARTGFFFVRLPTQVMTLLWFLDCGGSFKWKFDFFLYLGCKSEQARLEALVFFCSPFICCSVSYRGAMRLQRCLCSD
jgi:hypothetical protein